MYILGSCNILFFFNSLINIYAGVFVGDSFCPKGFVLLGGHKGGSRGRVQGVRTPPSRDDLRLSNTAGILQKKKLCGLLVMK